LFLDPLRISASEQFIFHGSYCMEERFIGADACIYLYSVQIVSCLTVP
jgi:hypothetical protein